MTAVIAHRGASRLEAENSLAAFRRARAVGADWIELDVRPLLGGGLAVHHDPRLPDGRALADLRVGALPPEVALLADALDACEPLGVNVEIKNDPTEPGYDATGRLAAAVVAVLLGREQPVVVSSFDLATIDAARDLGAATAWLVDAVDDDVLVTLAEHGHRTLHPWDGAVTAAVVAACRAMDVAVNIWTVDDPARLRELAAWGVAGIVTNVPDVAVATLR